MTSRDWDKLSPTAAKGLVKRIARRSFTAAQWEKSMQEVIPDAPATTTTSCGPMWMGMWMAWHRGVVLSGGV